MKKANASLTHKENLQKLLDALPKPVLNHIQHLERMRQDFVANVSHELRTPLTVIHGYLEMLIATQTDPSYKKMLNQMFAQTTRMQNLIADLLLLSSLESDELQSASVLNKPVNVYKLLKIILNEAKTLSKDKHKFILSADKDLWLKGNENECRTLFSNLIFNAVKYTPSDGQIEIVWKREGDKAIFEVIDSGIGIAKEHIPRLTERFYRVDKARSRESGGTGLGLAIVKHILIRHRGKLKIQSVLHKGSTFTCIFSSPYREP